MAGDPWAEDLELAGRWSRDVGPHVVLGVDGGATSTVCVAMAAEGGGGRARAAGREGEWEREGGGYGGRLLGRGEAGCSNRNSVGESSARLALEEAMAAALKAGNLPRAAVRAVCLGLAGVDRPGDVTLVTDWMRDVFAHGPELHVHNDAVAALASGTLGSLCGAVLIAGTGCIAYGINSEGREARASGGGPVLGDRGSGYAIATEALSAVMRSDDGRGPPTALHDAVLRQLGLTSAQELIGWAYRDAHWARIAALTRAVKTCAAEGDAESLRILNEAACELALSVTAVARTLQLAGADGMQTFPLVLVGGVLEPYAGFDFTEGLLAELSKLLPQAQPLKPKVEPAVGAALLARAAYERTHFGKR